MPSDVPGQFYFDASHFASESHNFEVQRTNHFEVVIDLEKLKLKGASGNTFGEHLRLSTKSVTAPKVSAEPIPLKHGNDTVKVAGSPQFEDLTITVYDTLGRDQLAVIQQWFNRVFDRERKLMGLVSDYKTTATLYMYSPDCSIVRRWILQGVWPKGFGQEQFSFDGQGDAQTISLDLSVDRYYEVTNT